MRLISLLRRNPRLLLFLVALALTLWGIWEWYRPPQPRLAWTVEAMVGTKRNLLPDDRTLLTVARTNYSNTQGALCFWDITRGRETHRTEIPAKVMKPGVPRELYVSASPDGRWIAAEDLGGNLFLVDHFGRLCHTLATTEDRGWHVPLYFNFRFAPDGRTLAYERADGQAVILWDLTAGKQTAVLPGAYRRFEFSPDSRSLAANSVNSAALGIWDVSTGKKRLTLDGHPNPVSSMCFTADSRRLATGLKALLRSPSRSTEIILWDAATGERLTTLPVDESTGDNLHTLAFANEGRLLLVSNHVHQNVLWDLSTQPPQNRSDVFCKNVKGVRNVIDFRAHPQFSPDGQWMIVGDEEEGILQLWDTATLTLQRRIRIPGTHHLCWFTPDSRLFWATGEHKELTYVPGWSGWWDRLLQRPARERRVEETTVVEIASGRKLLTVPGWFAGLTADRQCLITGENAPSQQTSTALFRRWAISEAWPLSWWLLGGAGLLWPAGLLSLWFRRKAV